MKDANIKIQIEQLASLIEAEINSLNDTEHGRVCRLLDAKEYLKRAWHSVDDSEFAPNDTAYETAKQIRPELHKTELLTHRVNVGLRALTLIHDMAKARSRVNMQDGTSLALFTSLAIREATA